MDKLPTNRKEFDELLKSVVEECANILVLAKSETLNKADPGEESPGEKTPAGSSSEGSSPDAPPAASEPDGDEGSAPPAASADAPPQSPDAGSDPTTGDNGDPAAGQGDFAAIKAEYSKLELEQLKVHFLAAKEALLEQLGQGAGAPPVDPAAAPPASPDASAAPPAAPPVAPPPVAASPVPPPAASPSPSGIDPNLGKKEFSSEGNGGIKKSDDTLDRLASLEKSLKDKDEQLIAKEAQFEAVLGKLAEVLEKTALRKSVASISEIGETQPEEITMPKSEFIQRCNQISSRPDLSKSDRELLSGAVLGTVQPNKVVHLFK
jgi:hypothetical protein